MGLKGVPGLRYAQPKASVQKGVKKRNNNVDNYEDEDYKQAKHQGPPEMTTRNVPRRVWSQ